MIFYIHYQRKKQRLLLRLQTKVLVSNSLQIVFSVGYSPFLPNGWVLYRKIPCLFLDFLSDCLTDEGMGRGFGYFYAYKIPFFRPVSGKNHNFIAVIASQ